MYKGISNKEIKKYYLDNLDNVDLKKNYRCISIRQNESFHKFLSVYEIKRSKTSFFKFKYR